ncbi:MAG: small subunit ribosomal protein S6 [Candidatus Peregrinibacteria bacterium Gr01-1014_25]|nr:MAG: small subunit ribosomal protein S6 [Candidatus Peregrinibacteria bacterium Gr01-1014_25]
MLRVDFVRESPMSTPVLTSAIEDNRVYEIAVLYPYPMQQKEEQQLLKSIEQIFDDVGAKQVAKDAWGRRGLAYPVGGLREGNYVILYYDMAPEKVKDVEQQLKILKGILRHMIITVPKNYPFIAYAKAFEDWQVQRVASVEREEREREEKLKQQVVEKAKRQTKRATKKADATSTTPVRPVESLDVQIDKIISDDSLNL